MCVELRHKGRPTNPLLLVTRIAFWPPWDSLAVFGDPLVLLLLALGVSGVHPLVAPLGSLGLLWVPLGLPLGTSGYYMATIWYFLSWRWNLIRISCKSWGVPGFHQTPFMLNPINYLLKLPVCFGIMTCTISIQYMFLLLALQVNSRWTTVLRISYIWYMYMYLSLNIYIQRIHFKLGSFIIRRISWGGGALAPPAIPAASFLPPSPPPNGGLKTTGISPQIFQAPRSPSLDHLWVVSRPVELKINVLPSAQTTLGP